MSWVAWVPYILSATGLGILDFTFPSLLGGTQMLGVLPGAYLGPILAAFVVTAVADGKEGVRRWLGRMTKWRVSWVWYLVAGVGVPAAIIITGVAMSDGDIHLPSTIVLVAYLPSLLIQMVTTGLAEEPGWRDFALPRMQRRFGPLGGTLILGPLWGLWHLPLFFSEWGGWPDVTWMRVGEFVAFCVAFSVVVTWVFNRTGQSLPSSCCCTSASTTSCRSSTRTCSRRSPPPSRRPTSPCSRAPQQLSWCSSRPAADSATARTSPHRRSPIRAERGRGAWDRHRSHAAPRFRAVRDAARQAMARRALRAAHDDVQAGRLGPTWTSVKDQARSNRSRFMTLSHAATKSCTNFSFASSLA